METTTITPKHAQTVTQHSELAGVQHQQPSVGTGIARVRDLTPAQQRAVMFAQQQVLKAREARRVKDERQAALRVMWQQEDTEIARQRVTTPRNDDLGGVRSVSLREALGHVLRDLRMRDHKTLREVSEKAGVSLCYLSEVERGQKEASSELLSSIAQALGLRTAQMLRMVADYLDTVEEFTA